jgi:hypothetical protein
MQTTVRIVIAIAGWLLVVVLYNNGTIDPFFFSPKQTPAPADQMTLLFRRSAETKLPAALMTTYGRFTSNDPIEQDARPPGFTHSFSVRAQDYALVPPNWPKVTDAELRDMEKQLEAEYQTSTYNLRMTPEGALAVHMNYDDGSHPRAELINYTTDGQRLANYSERQTNVIGLAVTCIIWFALYLLLAPFICRKSAE